MSNLRFAAIGAGFWARFQLSAWREVQGAQCVALCDVDRTRAEKLAHELGIAQVFDDLEHCLREVKPDFVDIITGRAAHAPCVRLALKHGIAAIVQKPMAESLEEAEELVHAFAQKQLPLLVHENWRWQAPLRELKRALDAGRIGTPFRARIRMVSGFPVFQNQPYLRNETRFLIADMGIHILDLARFLFGEAESVYCQTTQAHRDIQGEDVATVILKTSGGPTVICELGFAGNHLEVDRFPETFVLIEGTAGSLELAPDYWLRETTRDGTQARRCPPPHHAWADPAYDVVHASMVPCNENLCLALRNQARAETTGADNLETLRLVFDAYESAAGDRVVLRPGAKAGARREPGA